MALFQYPKFKHARTQKPRQFKKYRSYKRFLQHEFARVCIYCRQPDSSAPNLVFGVDHYRPKGIPRFSNLVCAYDNLYYCCNSCNSRKNNDWPTDENAGPYVVNPCDFEMASHLRFISKTGKVEAKTKHGQHTEELLQLNDETLVKFRLSTILTISALEDSLRKFEKLRELARKKLAAGGITQAEFNLAIRDIEVLVSNTQYFINSHTGELPLSPIKKARLGVLLVNP